MSSFFLLLDRTRDFFARAVVAEELSRYTEQVVFSSLTLTEDEKKAFRNKVQEFTARETESRELASRSREWLQGLRREFPDISAENLEKVLQEAIQRERSAGEVERQKLEAAIQSEEQAMGKLEKELEEIESRYPLVRFFVWSKIYSDAGEMYECRPLEGLALPRFVLFVEDLPEPDGFIGEYGVFKRRLSFVEKVPFETTSGGIIWSEVYTFLSPAKEREFAASKGRITAEMAQKEQSVQRLREAREEALQRVENSVKRLEEYLKTWEDLTAKRQSLARVQESLLLEVVKLIFQHGYTFFLAPHFGNTLSSFLFVPFSSGETEIPRVIDSLEERFLVLTQLLFQPLFEKPEPTRSTVTLFFQDVLTPAERKAVEKRMNRFPRLRETQFSLEKYVFNKWQVITMLPLPLFGKSVQVKYVPQKAFDEYRLVCSLFPELSLSFRYEHPLNEAFSKAPATPQGTPPLSKETEASPGFLGEEEQRERDAEEISFPTTLSLCDEMRIPLRFPPSFVGKTLAVAENSVEKRFPIEVTSFSLRIRFFAPGVKALTVRVLEGEKTLWERAGTVTVEETLLGEPVKERDGGFLVEVSEQLLEKLFGKERVVSLSGVSLFVGEENLVSYPGALLVAREVALRCGLPPGYDEYLKPAQGGVRLAQETSFSPSEEFFWVEGVYDFRGRPVPWRLRQLEARSRDSSSLLQARGVSAKGERFFPINTETPSLLKAAIFIPRALLEERWRIHIDKGGMKE